MQRVTQSASMNVLWHPAMHADWLVLRRAGPVALVRILAAPALLLACCAGIACGDLNAGYGWCLAAAALLALGGSHAIARQRLLDALQRWRGGWCAALPVARGAMAGTLLLITIVALVVSLAFATALLLGVSTAASHRGDLPYALAGIHLALVAGTTVAVVRVFRHGAHAAHREDGIREPVLALSWLNDPQLPHLLDWQRRIALVRWRRGGSFVMVGIVLGAVPMGAPALDVTGLVLLVLSWAWLATAMRASADASGAAARLLGATPLESRRGRAASLRYPFFAMGCALVPMVAGACLTGRSAFVPIWMACAGMASVWPLRRIFRATRPAGPST